MSSVTKICLCQPLAWIIGEIVINMIGFNKRNLLYTTKASLLVIISAFTELSLRLAMLLVSLVLKTSDQIENDTYSSQNFFMFNARDYLECKEKQTLSLNWN